MKQSNDDFVHRCELCGNDDLVLSEVILKANYGSRHDMTTLRIRVCGDCMDKIIGAVQKEKGSEED